MRTDGERIIQLLDDIFAGLSAFAWRVTEAAATCALLDVEDQVIAWSRCDTHGNVIEAHTVAGLPCDHVVGAGSIAAYSERPNNVALFVVQSESSAENDHAPDGFSESGSSGCPNFWGSPANAVLGLGPLTML